MGTVVLDSRRIHRVLTRFQITQSDLARVQLGQRDPNVVDQLRELIVQVQNLVTTHRDADVAARTVQEVDGAGHVGALDFSPR